jgi:hypothetical protein
MTREFVAHMPTSDFKSEKAYIINRSNEAVKQPVVNLAEYAEEVFQDKEVAKSFSDYTRERSAEKGCIIDDRIEVSSQAVKSKIRTNVSVLKLDGNFDIYIHGGEDRIEKGYDEERGLKYYKLYFSKEK